MSKTEDLTAGPNQIAGLWRRLFAFLIDCLMLGLLGAGLGLFLYDCLARMGGWGRVIGFAIAFSYFGVMNSRICGGHTLGKMAMKIKLVSRNGLPLSISASFWRSGILCALFFLNGVSSNVELLQSRFLFVLSFLIFGLSLSIVYLFIFNWKTRQSLHDLPVGSYVIMTGGKTILLLARNIWGGHFAVIAILMTLAAAVSISARHRAEKEQSFSFPLTLQQALTSEHGVRYATVRVGTGYFAGFRPGSSSTTHFDIHVITNSRAIDRQALADKIAQITLNNADADKKDVISILISYGYNIGIASGWRSQNYVFSPAQWRQRLALKSNSSLQPFGGINEPITEMSH